MDYLPHPSAIKNAILHFQLRDKSPEQIREFVAREAALGRWTYEDLYAVAASFLGPASPEGMEANAFRPGSVRLPSIYSDGASTNTLVAQDTYTGKATGYVVFSTSVNGGGFANWPDINNGESALAEIPTFRQTVDAHLRFLESRAK